MNKVLHIFSSYGGGISSLVINLIENKTNDFVFDTMCFSYKNGEQFIERVKNCGGQCFLMPRIPVDGFFKFRRYVEKVFQENKYDIVHCHIAGYTTLLFRDLAKKSGVKKIIIHAHTCRYDRCINRIFPVFQLNRVINYKVADLYMGCSDLASDYIFGKKYQKKKETVFIPNGFNFEKYHFRLDQDCRNAYIKEFDVENKKILLHIGRFSYPKNHKFIVEIMRLLLEKSNDYVLLMVGEGKLKQDIQIRCEKTKIQKNVRFLGARSDIPNLLQFADLAILPSYYEGLPTVAVECQAAGTPLLLADTITRQCDMGIGLLSFLPITNATLWRERILNSLQIKMDPLKATSAVEEKGFAANCVGKLYCEKLQQLLEDD